jgi:hypothetical protein
MWGIWCNVVQCLVMVEFKQIRVSSLKPLTIASLPLGNKEVL